MSYSDVLWNDRCGLIDEMLQCSDPDAFKTLIATYLESVQELMRFIDDESITGASLLHCGFSHLLEELGIAVHAEEYWIGRNSDVATLVKFFMFCSPLKRYCEEMYLNGGLIGILRYGSAPTYGHELVQSALKICSSV